MVINAGSLVLTKVLKSAPHGGGPDAKCNTLQELKERKVKSMLFDIIIGQVMLLRNNIDSRINQV